MIDDQAALQLEVPTADSAPVPVALNTPHARAMLRKRYPPGEWACMFEVAPSTGGGTRYADAVAVNLWASRGHAVVGFEIKVSRSDWLRELKKPEKAEGSVYRYCDQWFIVAPKGVVKDGELPPTWGLLELRATGLVQTVAAPKLEPQPVSRVFFASLMRRGHEQLDALAAAKQRDAVNAVYADVEEQIRRGVAQRATRHEALAERLDKIKAETGLDFESEYGRDSIDVKTIKLAQHLKALEGWHGKGALSKLAELAKDLDRASATVRQAAAATGLIGEVGHVRDEG